MILMIFLSNLLELEKMACSLRKLDWYNLKQMQQGIESGAIGRVGGIDDKNGEKIECSVSGRFFYFFFGL
jgi:hypothetical protein